MRCPKCGSDHKKSEGMVCSSCHRTFVFHPTEDGWTDGRMTALIRAVGGDGTYHFTANQLYERWARRYASKRPGRPLVFGVIGVVLAVLAALGGIAGLALLLGAAAVIGFGLAISRAQAGPPSRTHFADLLARWRAREEVERLIDAPTLKEPPPNWREPDIYDYGVEGVLVVDDDRLVDLLVQNGFHAEHRLAVVSAGRYPQYVVPRVNALLTERPDLPVFALHAAGVEEDLAARLPGLGLGVTRDHPVTDLGWHQGEVVGIRRLAALKLARWTSAVPVDLLPPGVLLGALGAAVDQGVPLAALLGAGSGDSAGAGDGGGWVGAGVGDFG